MKLQIAGFDIEFNQDQDTLAIKVLDANGKELSNNTYSQSLDTTDDVEDVTVPGVEEVDETTDEETIDEETTDEETTDEETTDDMEDLDDELADLEDIEESFLTFEQYKKRKKSCKK